MTVAVLVMTGAAIDTIVPVISNVSVPEMGGISPATAMAFVAPEAGVHTPVGRIAQDHAETAIWGGTLSTICADDVKSPVLVTCTVNVIC